MSQYVYMICPKDISLLFSKSDSENEEITPIYFGSTYNLSKRWSGHLSGYKYWKNGNINASRCSSYILFDKYGVENCTIIILEEFYNLSDYDLAEKEDEYIESYKCVNKNRPNNLINNPNYKKKYSKKWRVENNYCKENVYCECGKRYTKPNKHNHTKTKTHQKYINFVF